MVTLSKIWRPAAAELFVTFTFVFAGVGAAGAATRLGQGDATLLLIGLGHGLGIMVGVATAGRVSGGHMNPAVSIAAWITGNLGTPRLVAYVAAQLLGAVLAVLALDRVFGIDGLGVHGLGAGVGAGTGFGLEAILTFFLVFAVFATAIDPRGNASLAPLVIGSVIAFDHFVAIPLTGASMNPARSFGPALVHGEWGDHWVYWVGPIAGGILAAVAYARIFGDATLRKRAAAPFREPDGTA